VEEMEVTHPPAEDIEQQRMDEGVTNSSTSALFEQYTSQQKLEYARINLSSTNPTTRGCVQQLLTSCFEPNANESEFVFSIFCRFLFANRCDT